MSSGGAGPSQGRGLPAAPSTANAWKDEEMLQMITLVADFLERSAGLKEAAGIVRSHAEEKLSLPDTISWNGVKRKASIPDHRSLKALPCDHLKMIIGSGMDVEEEQHNAGNHNILAEVSQAIIRKAKDAYDALSSKLHRTPASHLFQLRYEMRQLEREIAAGNGRNAASLESMIAEKRHEAESLLSTLSVFPQIRRAKGINTLDALEMNRASGPTPSERAIELSRLTMLHKIMGHRALAYCTAASHERWIVTGADDFLVKLWDGATGRLHHSFRGHQNVITDLALTKDLVASGSEDCTVRIWEVNTTRPFIVLARHKQPVQRVQFSPDESRLFTSADDGACCVWDVESMRLQALDRDRSMEAWITLEKERRRHASLSTSNAGQDSTINETPVIQPQPLDDSDLMALYPRQPPLIEPPLVFPHCDSNATPVKIVCMAVHPSGKVVATGSEDHLGRVWSIDHIPPVENTKRSPAPTTAQLITGDYQDGADRLLCTLSGHSEGVIHHIEWSNRGDRILTFSDKDGTCRIWFWRETGDPTSKSGSGAMDDDTQAGSAPEEKQNLNAQSRGIGRIKLMPSVIDMVQTPANIALKVLPPMCSSDSPGARNNGKMPSIDAAGWSCNDSFVVTTQSVKPSSFRGEDPGFYDSRVCVWDSRTGALIRFMRGHRAEAHVLRMHPNLDFVGATCGSDGMIFVWDIVRGVALSRLDAISTEGYPSILDARWCLQGNHACDFIATDSMGRLLLLGSGTAAPFAATPPEQYLSSERSEFILDPNTHEALDATLKIPLHLVKKLPVLMDVYDYHYPEQPPPVRKNEGSFLDFDEPVQNNYKRRLSQALEKKRALEQKEAARYQKERQIIEKMNDAIHHAIDLDSAESNQVAKVVERTSSQRVSRPRKNQDLRRERESQVSAVEEEEEEEEEVEAEDGRHRRAAARRALRRVRRLGQSNGEDPASDNGEDDRDPDAESAPEEEDDDDDDESDDEYSGSDAEDRRRRGRGQSRTRRGISEYHHHYSTRRVNMDYSRIEDGDYYADARPSTEATNRSRRRQSAAQPVEQVGYSDLWLTQKASSINYYVPQEGDEVLYFAQGHLEYLRDFPSTDPPPWEKWNSKQSPYVQAYVERVTHVFPDGDTPHAILARTKLVVRKMKSSTGGDALGFVDVDPTAEQIAFEVNYHPTMSSFLVLVARCRSGLQQADIGVDQRVLYIGNNNDATTFDFSIRTAIVKELQVQDEEKWPDSPWKALVCQDEQNGETLHLSPWNVQNARSKDFTLNHVVDEETEEFWNKEVQQMTVQAWLKQQLESCPNWSALSRVRRHPNLPCFVNILLVADRLIDGKYYRQLDAIAADFQRIVDCANFERPNTSAAYLREEKFREELKEIINFAGSGEESELGKHEIDVAFLRAYMLDAIEQCSAVDREGFFQEPVDLERFPDYLEYITTPMDFTTLRSRVEKEELGQRRAVSFARARRFLRSIVHDVRLIAENAMEYNMEGTIAHNSGKSIQRKLREVFGAIDFEIIDQKAFMESHVHNSRQSGARSRDQSLVRMTSRGRAIHPTRAFSQQASDDVYSSEEEEDDDDASFGRRRSKRARRAPRRPRHGYSDDDESEDGEEGFYLPRRSSTRAAASAPRATMRSSRVRLEEMDRAADEVLAQSRAKRMARSDRQQPEDIRPERDRLTKRQKDESVSPVDSPSNTRPRRSVASYKQPVDEDEPFNDEPAVRRSSRVTRSTTGQDASLNKDEGEAAEVERPSRRGFAVTSTVRSRPTGSQQREVTKDQDEQIASNNERPYPTRSTRNRGTSDKQAEIADGSDSDAQPLADERSYPTRSTRSRGARAKQVENGGESDGDVQNEMSLRRNARSQAAEAVSTDDLARSSRRRRPQISYREHNSSAEEDDDADSDDGRPRRSTRSNRRRS